MIEDASAVGARIFDGDRGQPPLAVVPHPLGRVRVHESYRSYGDTLVVTMVPVLSYYVIDIFVDGFDGSSEEACSGGIDDRSSCVGFDHGLFLLLILRKGLLRSLSDS